MEWRDLVPEQLKKPLREARLRRYHLEAAQRHDVEAVCHPQDFIYQFVRGALPLRDGVNYYFDDGARSAALFAEVVGGLPVFQGRLRVLEFASGYGCVTRHLKKDGRWSLVACDIHQDAIDFLQRELSVANAVLSSRVPEELPIHDTFDVVFALSFFSHMPRTTWGRWIKALFSRLAPGGLLLFTAQGDRCLAAMGNPEMPAEGFYFVPMSEQGDLSTTEYGTTVVTPEFVAREVFEQTGAAIFDVKPAFWWSYQDLYVVRKD